MPWGVVSDDKTVVMMMMMMMMTMVVVVAVEVVAVDNKPAAVETAEVGIGVESFSSLENDCSHPTN
jgi:hypothetical protein